MARINIEDSLFREDGFLNLIEKTGNRYSAMGMVVSAFILSQKFYIKHGLIPFKEWPEALEVLIEVRLAERVKDGIYVRGSKEAFAWLKQKSEAGSVISGLKSEQLKKAREAKKIKNEAESIERSLNGDCTGLNGSEAPTLTLSLTPTLSQDLTQNSNSNSNSNSLVEEAVVKNHLPVKSSKAVLHGCLPELNLHEISTALFSGIKLETQKGWLAAYPNAQWICHEALKANIWMNENPNKKPKNFGRFFSNWLSTGFESYRKGLPSNNQKKSFAQTANDKALELMRHFEEEEKNANQKNNNG